MQLIKVYPFPNSYVPRPRIYHRGTGDARTAEGAT
jgi:hypothetical protein